MWSSPPWCYLQTVSSVVLFRILQSSYFSRYRAVHVLCSSLCLFLACALLYRSLTSPTLEDNKVAIMVSQFFLDLPRDEATHHLLMGLCPHSNYHTASKQWAYLMQENADFRESGWALLCWLLTQDLALGRCYMCDQWASDGTNIRNKQRSVSWILKILLILNGHRLDFIYWTSGFIIFLNSWELLWQRGGIVLRVNTYLGINRVIIML